MISGKWNALRVGTQQRAFLVIYLPRPCEATTNICVRTSVWRAPLRSQTARCNEPTSALLHHVRPSAKPTWSSGPGYQSAGVPVTPLAKLFADVTSETVLTNDTFGGGVWLFGISVCLRNSNQLPNCFRPQVPGGPSGRAASDGSQPGAGTRGVYNLRARSIPRQTTAANVLLDTDKLNVLTYNVRTLLNDERLVELENSLKDIRWDIVGLSEVRRGGEATEERDDNIFFHIGTGSGLHGVGFLVDKKWKNNIIEFRGYSERIAVLKFRLTHTKTLTLVQTYAPTSAYSDDDVEDYYDLLNKACEDNRGTFNIVLGDFNAKIGARQDQDDDKIIGPHGLGTRNERGSRLLQFAFGQMLSISNTFFTKKPQRRWTWMSPDGRTKNEIDFILSSFTHDSPNDGTPTADFVPTA
ncbi:hypothetical protein B5X24_HaOG204917 [Helicoverpa armigera]|uniref:Endonuclease/exonuclease/phosphatase domain-containing protein n=1 Tax=Helicoverpa armigera TaxID=29058 RepID=A0A2W1BWQ0_HELAM|nr:hypothetical protein B5X24_HaOG204917 [Helicoverpa armigera]